jgi:hypothetical protein
MLNAYVPRNLRVRASIQLASTRVPARTFLIVAGLLFMGGLLVVGGADLMRTVKLSAALIIISLIVFELRCWGRSMREVAHILWRHYRRPRQLRLDPLMVALPVEISMVVATRRPRWQS